MPGYSVNFDESATDIEVLAEGGVPFAIAKKAALEELAGVQGDINEGDVSGRVEDEPDIEDKLETQSDLIEKASETDYRPDAIALTEDQQKLVDALIEDGEGIGFYTQIVDDPDNVPAAVQKWFDGLVTLQDVIDHATLNGFHEKTVEVATQLATPAPRL